MEMIALAAGVYQRFVHMVQAISLIPLALVVTTASFSVVELKTIRLVTHMIDVSLELSAMFAGVSSLS